MKSATVIVLALFEVAMGVNLRETIQMTLDLPSNKKCANDEEKCDCVGTVYYGANGMFSGRDVVGRVKCSQEIFGNPQPGGTNACYCVGKLPPNTQKCANEGENGCSGCIGKVIYGVNSKWVSKAASGYPTLCTADNFGEDPAPNKVKTCRCWAEPDQQWATVEPATMRPLFSKQCASEGGQCTCPGKIYYGTTTPTATNKVQFTTMKSDGTTSFPCNSEVFGDPVYGATKACYCDENILSASWGYKVDCPVYSAIQSVCSSGRDADCSGKYTRVRCTPTDDMLSSRQPQLLESKNWGEWLSCPSGTVVTSLCTSGENKDCDWDNNGKGPTTIQCSEVLAPWSISKEQTDYLSLCCDYGKTCTCPPEYYVVDICTSGRDPDCGTSFCYMQNRAYTGIRCAKLKRSQPKTPKWSFIGSWRFIGNTPSEFTYGTVVSDGSATTEEQSKSIRNEASKTLTTSIETKPFGMGASVGYEYTSTYSSETALSEARTLEHTIETSTQQTCSPNLGSVKKMLAAAYYEKFQQPLSSTSLKFFKWEYAGLRAGEELILDTRCNFLLVYAGMRPKCPPIACKDHPLCQTCCYKTENGQQQYRECGAGEIVTSNFDSALSSTLPDEGSAGY